MGTMEETQPDKGRMELVEEKKMGSQLHTFEQRFTELERGWIQRFRNEENSPPATNLSNLDQDEMLKVGTRVRI